MILGLIGGVGSGKSTVTKVLKEEYGFELLLTDDIAKQLELPGGCCYEALVKAFGEGILQDGPGSRIDNPKLAARIYADAEALKTVNGIVHPAVWRYVSDYIDEAEKCLKTANPDESKFTKISTDTADISLGAAAEKERAGDICSNKGQKKKNVRIAVETALPNDTFKKLCDEIWFIYTEREIRIKRLMSDRGYTRERSESIIAGQLADDVFNAAADVTVDNSGKREATENAVRARLKTVLQDSRDI